MTVPPEQQDQSPTRRLKPRLLALAGVFALVVATGGVVFLGAGEKSGGSMGSEDPLGLAMRPPIPQARWDIDVDPIRVPDTKLTKPQRKRVAERREGITSLVRDVYDSLFFDRKRLRAEVRGRFTRATASAILRPQFGFPARAHEIKTFRRSADIAVEAGRGSEATAEVTVNAQASIGPEALRVVHRATLWLLRHEGRWKVVALAADQEPVR